MNRYGGAYESKHMDDQSGRHYLPVVNEKNTVHYRKALVDDAMEALCDKLGRPLTVDEYRQLEDRVMDWPTIER